MPSYFNVGRMIKKAANKPLAIAHRCRDEIKDLEAGYHSRLYDIVAAAYAAAWHFRKSPNRMEEVSQKAILEKGEKAEGRQGRSRGIASGNAVRLQCRQRPSL